MTPVPVVPAVPISDEQLEAVKGLLNECPLLGHPLNRSTVDALLARLDAAEERADRAENNFDTLVDVNAGLAAERDAALARVLPEGAVSIVGERMAMVRQCTDVAQSGEFCVCPDSHRHGTGGGGCVCCSPGPLYRLIPYRPEKEAGT